MSNDISPAMVEYLHHMSAYLTKEMCDSGGTVMDAEQKKAYDDAKAYLQREQLALQAKRVSTD